MFKPIKMSLLGFLLLMFGLMQWTTTVSAGTGELVARATGKPSPSPISIPASQYWDGVDGPWSSFTILVGSPAQTVRVFLSTASHNILVIRSDACAATDTQCQTRRGALFNPNTSSTWQQRGFFQLGVEQNLGISASGFFGEDTVALGIPGNDGPSLQDQVVSASTDNQFFLGLFGIGAVSTSFSATSESPSYLSSLKTANVIPSLSFGYTAGNQYRLKQVFGSLVLGGYDSSLFTPNSVNFSMASDVGRELMVEVQSISSSNQNGTGAVLSGTSFMASLDTTTPVFWLPQAVCQQFERAFDLTRDATTGLYLVNDTLHQQLLKQNATVAFTLGKTSSGGQTVNITLPYNSFDLSVAPPAFGVNQSQNYFPIRQAANETQYTLGRAFFQEVYLTADWERRSFFVSQCLFSPNAKQNLVAINSSTDSSSASSPSASTLPSSSSSSSSTGKTVGIAVGVTLGVLAIVVGVVIFLLLQRRKRRRVEQEPAVPHEEPNSRIREGFVKQELGAGHDNQRYEVEGDRPEIKPSDEPAMSSWVDEKARYPGDRSHMVEADPSSSNLPEMGGSSSHLRRHELYDESSRQRRFELSADQPKELVGSTPGPTTPNSPTSSPRRSRGFRSPFSKFSSPLSSESPPSSPRQRKGNQTPQSRSSLLGSLRRKRLSTGRSTPVHPPDDQENGAGGGDADIHVPQPPPSNHSDSFSPVSGEGTLAESGPSSLTPDIRSPISPESPGPSRVGVFERLRRRS